jgi:hypothetical protein
MAQVTSLRDDSRKQVNKGLIHVQKVIAVVNGSAASGDNIEVTTFKETGFLHRVSVRQSATLGASATAAAQHFDGTTHTALTGATTAGAASKVDSDSNANVPLAIKPGDKLELNIAGAGITASANLTVDFYYSA